MKSSFVEGFTAMDVVVDSRLLRHLDSMWGVGR